MVSFDFTNTSQEGSLFLFATHLMALSVAWICLVLNDRMHLHCIHFVYMSFIACVVLCAVFCLSVMCYFL
jgi:hypothetical protein